VHGKGNVDFTTPLGEIKIISNVLYIPSMKKSLFFIGTIDDRGYIVIFYAKKCTLVNPRKPNYIAMHGNIVPKNGLYKLKVCLANMIISEIKVMKETKLWHRRMGHVNFKSLH